jgi:hypothetical protein
VSTGALYYVIKVADQYMRLGGGLTHWRKYAVKAPTRAAALYVVHASNVARWGGGTPRVVPVRYPTELT